mgnify:CR=1 FL=1
MTAFLTFFNFFSMIFNIKFAVLYDSFKISKIMEILILVSKITNRLFYIIELIFKDELGINFKFTTDKEKYLAYEGPKFHYGQYPLEDRQKSRNYTAYPPLYNISCHPSDPQ